MTRVLATGVVVWVLLAAALSGNQAHAQSATQLDVRKAETLYYLPTLPELGYGTYGTPEEGWALYAAGITAATCGGSPEFCVQASNFRQCTKEDLLSPGVGAVGFFLIWGEANTYCYDRYRPYDGGGPAALIYPFSVCPAGEVVDSSHQTGSGTLDDPTNYEPICVKPTVVSSRCQAPLGNPIYAQTGTKREYAEDFRSGNSVLNFSRTYDSATGSFSTDFDIDFEPPVAMLVRPNETLYAAVVTSNSGLGGPDYAIPKRFSKVNVDGTHASFTTSTGAQTTFSNDGSGWVPVRPDFKDRLTTSGSDAATQWVLRRLNEGEVLVADNAGRLVRRQQSGGAGVTLAYDLNGYLATITDDFGRQIAVGNVDASGHPQLNSIVTPAGEVIEYTYNAAQQLSQVKFADARYRTYVWDEPAYSTGTATNGGLLTGIVDELQVRYATFSYADGRAIGTEHANGVERYTVTDARTGLPATGSVTIDYPTGSTYTAVYDAVLGQSREISNEQPAGAGCSAASSARTFDPNGNVASSTDPNGSQTCLVSDQDTNFALVRVEGLGEAASCTLVTAAGVSLPTGSRKRSTQWHPDWMLPTRVAEPGRLTTSVYNGQPDPFNGGAIAACAPATSLLPDGTPIAALCKQVEQATTDTDGHLGFGAALQTSVPDRVQQWTYNQYGQILTVRDALGNLTQSEYYADTSFTGADPNAVGHTIGDLMKVTNAAGNATTYDSYNKNGYLLQSTDPNGVSTGYTYDARQRLTSSSEGDRTTLFDHDAAGRLVKVTAPDGSWIGYEYDAAHRKTATTDNLGNRIESTLDNAGNVTQQNVNDPQGRLARGAAQSIDALDRVQQTVGH